jgi:hypothetical protein
VNDRAAFLVGAIAALALAIAALLAIAAAMIGNLLVAGITYTGAG